jgi:transketolase
MSDALPVVYLARHGETAWTKSHQHTGRTNLPLTPQGEAEARRLGQRLKGPGLVTLRPGDANEVVEAYRYVLQRRHQPAVLALSRQPLPTLDRNVYASAAGVARGAYVLADPAGGNPEIILIASGSELSLAVEAQGKLAAEGIRARVVSMPSWDIFEQQTQDYRDSVLPPAVKARVAIEQGSTFGWERYVGGSGHVIGMKTFGASAPLKALQHKFGFEPERVVASAKEVLGKP